jgi:uncharacterized phage-associated protein
MSEPEVQFDRSKFLDVIHYIVDAFDDPRELGNVKLHKALYFSDMLMYAATGVPITGVDYQKQQFGPVARHLTWALRELTRAGRINTERKDYYGFQRLEMRSLRRPELHRIAEAERSLLDDVIAFVRNRSAREISELSHTAVWESRQIGDPIPYYTAFNLAPTVVTDEDVAWGVEEARKIAV